MREGATTGTPRPVLEALLTRGDRPGHEVAIGLPEARTYRTLHRRTRGSLGRLDIEVMFVNAQGRISTG